MNRGNRFLVWVCGIWILLTIGAFIFYRHLLYDNQGKPFCHKVINTAFRLWCHEHTTDIFPNIGGHSSESLAAIREELATTEVEENYHYIPGLRQSDPGHLVLLYYARPTRWTAHILAPSVFTKKAWIIVPVDFTSSRGRKIRGPGEESERVTETEFRRALMNTLDFLRTNERPNWQTVVAEHGRFLDAK